MNSSLKGALLSGLIFPGLGQFVLKHYKRGIALMLTVFVSLLIIVVKVGQQAFSLLKKIGEEGDEMNLSTILNATSGASTTSDSLTYYIVLFLVIFCWVVGVGDAYRIGKKEELGEQNNQPSSPYQKQ